MKKIRWKKHEDGLRAEIKGTPFFGRLVKLKKYTYGLTLRGSFNLQFEADSMQSAKNHATWSMCRLAEALAPLAEEDLSDCIKCMFCGDKGGKHKKTCVSYGGNKK